MRDPRGSAGLHPHYEDQPALNDGATPFAITTLLAAASTLGRPELLDAARRGGDWLLGAGAAPHGGWAQQYTPAASPAPGAGLRAARARELGDAARDRRAPGARGGDGRSPLLRRRARRGALARCVAWGRVLGALLRRRTAPVFVDADGQRARSHHVLDLPLWVSPVAVIRIGWPIGRYGPTTRVPVGDAVHFDQYSNRPYRGMNADFPGTGGRAV